MRNDKRRVHVALRRCCTQKSARARICVRKKERRCGAIQKKKTASKKFKRHTRTGRERAANRIHFIVGMRHYRKSLSQCARLTAEAFIRVGQLSVREAISDCHRSIYQPARHSPLDLFTGNLPRTSTCTRART